MPSRLRAIVAAFEPFGGRRRNRAWDAVAGLADERGVERISLPVDFAALTSVLPALIERAPEVLLLVGEAGWTRHLSVERVALNVAHARIPDNCGAKPRLAEIVPGAPLALPARWDAERVLDAAIEAAPTLISHHAGTFACNASFYLALHAAPVAMSVGFLHVPALPWPLAPGTSRLTAAVRAVVLTMLAAHAN